MPVFSYEAINKNGLTVKGSVEADSSEAAENMLGERGYVPTRITAGKDAAYSGYSSEGGGILARLRAMMNTFKASELIIFTKQFRSMMKAGVPIIRLLQVLEAQTPNPAIRNAITRMVADIRQGGTLFDAIEKHPQIFSPLYVSMIKAGEISGTVPEVLQRLTYIIEHEAKIKSDMKAALQYPLTVLIALGVAFIVLLTFVIPKFAQIFIAAGLDLPLPTQIAVLMYNFLKNYWALLLGVIFATIFVLRGFFRTAGGRLTLDNLLLKIPLLGPLFLKAALSRFASIMAILYASGVHVMTSMEIVSATIGNRAISNQLDQVRERIREGQGIAQPLRSAKHFTPMVVDMIAIGEESGNIEEMLREITAHYDDEVAYEVKTLSDAVGPILMVGLAVVVGFFALAIFLPMWDMTKMVK